MGHAEQQRRPSKRRHLSPGRQPARRRVAALAVLVAIGATLAIVLQGGGGQRGPTSAQARPAGTAHGARRARTQSGAWQLRAEQRVLSYTGYISAGSRRHADVALTFDDGPGPFTPRILAVLERFGARATFFEIGRQVRAYPRMTARLARAGMVIGDHTQNHPRLAALTRRQQAVELDHAARAIRAAGGPRPVLFRPPYRSFNPATLALLRTRQMLMVLWTIDTSDYARPGTKRIIYTALSGARPGAIILFHDGGGDRSQTLAALPRIIRRLRQRGYRLVTIPELLRDDPPPASQPPPRSLGGGPRARACGSRREGEPCPGRGAAWRSLARPSAACCAGFR